MQEKESVKDFDPGNTWAKWMMGAVIFAVFCVACLAVLDQHFWPHQTSPRPSSAQK